ncbi:MAG: hypothetical protein OWV35_07070 [Firmicutes bacterium]|nr:hypothetical protein [Bacillota bacterium]
MALMLAADGLRRVDGRQAARLAARGRLVAVPGLPGVWLEAVACRALPAAEAQLPRLVGQAAPSVPTACVAQRAWWVSARERARALVTGGRTGLAAGLEALARRLALLARRVAA